MPHAKAIDIVYLWVDGSDAVWRHKRARAARGLSARDRAGLALHSNVEGRFRDNDELRYNLRALQRFFPGHGHIYLVTDAQTPAWLVPSAGLSVVDHRALMPAAALPTFDSGHIESYIHHIEGLSERFIYLNDDVFFGKPVVPGDWFWENGTYATWSDEPPVADAPLHPQASALVNASRLSRQWLAAHEPPSQGTPAAPYAHTFRTFAHSPRPMLRSLLYELEGLAPGLFDSVRSTVFRTWHKPTIVSDFVIRWALAHGRVRLRESSHAYVGSGDVGLARSLDALASRFGEVDFCCINDTTDDAPSHDPRLGLVRGMLQQCFPDASRFERMAPGERRTGPRSNSPEPLHFQPRQRLPAADELVPLA